jgi:transcriptional regulator GlxA family with amidase domain
VIAYLNKNYREDVSIAKLCKIGSMSKSSLMRNFKKTTGVSPLQYMLNLRLGDVAVLLRSTGKQFYEIAGICGFNDVNYMGRKFKQFQDVTLREYRKKYQYTDIVRE